MNLPETVTKKVGPLPVWMYVVIGSGAILVLKMMSGGSKTTSGSSGSGSSGVDYGPGDGGTGQDGQDGQDGAQGDPGSFSLDYRSHLTQLFGKLDERATLLSKKTTLTGDIRNLNTQINAEKNAAAKRRLTARRDEKKKQLDETNTALAAIEKVVADLQKWLSENS